MTIIDASTDLDSVAERLGVGGAEELRSSTSRREPHLQKYARIMSRNPDIDLRLNPENARVKMEDGLIEIPTRKFEQPVTDIPRRTYDLLAQETLATHECGHLLYSDWPSLQDCINAVEQCVIQDDDDDDHSWKDVSDWSAVFKHCWNAMEDGVIEAELAKHYRVRNQIDVLNANMTEAGSVVPPETTPNGDAVHVYDMQDAIVQCLLDESVYDSGRTRRILDPDDPEYTMTLSEEQSRFEEVVDDIRNIVQECKQTPDAEERNWKFCVFFQEVLYPLLKQSETPGISGSDKNHRMEEHRADDAHEGIGEAREDLDLDADGEAGAAGAGGEDDEADGDDGDDQTGGRGPGGDEEEDDEDGDVDGPGEDVEQEAQEKYQETLKREAMEAMGDGLMEELEEFQAIMQGGTEVTIEHIVVPESKAVDAESKQAAKALGRQLAPIIRNQLRESQTNAVRRRKSFGSVDTRSMIDAERGSLRVFQRDRDSDDKDYSCVLVMDRSGSMAGDIHETETAIGAFMYALEACGVDVMCLDFCNDELRLAKPFGSDVDEHAGTLFTGESGGGTPLADALYFARRRVENGAGTHPFVMVVTDGRAGNQRRYEEQLTKTTVPVIGLYLALSQSRGSGNPVEEAASFHRVRPVMADDSLATVLQQLATEVML